MIYTSANLDQFVAAVDGLGGPTAPGCNELMARFIYKPGFKVRQALDPFSEAYVAEQVALYEEVSGRRYDVHQNEMMEFDVERHISAANPYDHPNPGTLAIHLQRLSRALRHASPKRGETLLDMGCGWGLSSELAAYLGLSVIAVDVNPQFIRLVRERAIRAGRTIKAEVSTFEDFRPAEAVDIALFYECLHHAVRPWTVTALIAGALRPGGRIVLAGEPINANWWEHWGLRLDALSIYCIRKFGWFESGWSLPFIQQVLYRSGLLPRTFLSEDVDIGPVIVAEKPAEPVIPGDVAGQLFASSGTLVDGPFLILIGVGTITVPFPSDARFAVLNLVNYRAVPLRVLMSCDATIYQDEMPPGEQAVKLPRSGQAAEVQFRIENWVPEDELQNGDRRTLGLHLRSIEFTP